MIRRPRQDLPLDVSAELLRAVETGVEQVASWIRERRGGPEELTAPARLQGLAALWAEARVSFAYWDNVPDLDWDGAFRDHVPEVLALSDPAAYYDCLRRFIALLNDGHCWIQAPPWLPAPVRPALEIRLVEDLPVVTGGEGLPRGAVITHVDGRRAGDVIADLDRTQFAGTPHHRRAKNCAAVLRGPAEKSAEIRALLPGGGETVVVLPRGAAGSAPRSPRSFFGLTDLGQGRIAVRVDSWGEAEVVDLFNEAFPHFDGVSGMIVDLRENGGGDSRLAETFLARLIQRPAPTETCGTPLYWGARVVWDSQHLVVTAAGKHVQPDTSRPRFNGPVAVLTSPYTVSAAEDFCVAYRGAGRGPIVGQTTAGTTGNPSVVPLPGGGLGFICATRCTCPDGTVFVGRGIEPDVPAAPTIAGVSAGMDEVLEAAQEVLGAYETPAPREEAR